MGVLLPSGQFDSFASVHSYLGSAMCQQIQGADGHSVFLQSAGVSLHDSTRLKAQSRCLVQHSNIKSGLDLKPHLHLMRSSLVLAPKSLERSNANATLHDKMSPCRAHLIASSCCLAGFEQQCIILMPNKEEETNNLSVLLHTVASLAILPHNAATTIPHKAPPPLIFAF